jgi:small subunit ribosomal protein S5
MTTVRAKIIKGKDKPEFDHKALDIRRVARVVKGGRRFSLRVVVVVGDRRGRVGLGTGKAVNVSLAIEKAVRRGKKQLITVSLTKNSSIPYPVQAKFGASKILIKPAAEGRGLSAGGSVRAILELAGIRNASAKLLSRSKNRLNNAQAALKALASLG